MTKQICPEEEHTIDLISNSCLDCSYSLKRPVVVFFDSNGDKVQKPGIGDLSGGCFPFNRVSTVISSEPYPATYHNKGKNYISLALIGLMGLIRRVIAKVKDPDFKKSVASKTKSALAVTAKGSFAVAKGAYGVADRAVSAIESATKKEIKNYNINFGTSVTAKNASKGKKNTKSRAAQKKSGYSFFSNYEL